MREFKFRAKSIHTNKWVYGWPFPSFMSGFRMRDTNRCEWEIDEDTISQYTGIKDKDGTEIYDGDIVDAPINNVAWEGNNCGISSTPTVEFVDGYYILRYKHNNGGTDILVDLCGLGDKIKVIGNIYDKNEDNDEE